MRAISIRQPWAWLIVHGFKTIENRDWSTSYRGPVLIHASKTCTRKYHEEVTQSVALMLAEHTPPIPRYEDLERGGIVGRAEIVDCITADDSLWFVGPHGFLLRDAYPLPFVEWKGKLGFFDVPRSALQGPCT